MFASHNSGTYNNQWMVLDVEALQGERKEGVLWVLEQLPGTVEAADVSEVLLSQGYWPSFNVPYFPRIYNMSGYPADQDIHRSATHLSDVDSTAAMTNTCPPHMPVVYCLNPNLSTVSAPCTFALLCRLPFVVVDSSVRALAAAGRRLCWPVSRLLLYWHRAPSPASRGRSERERCGEGVSAMLLR